MAAQSAGAAALARRVMLQCYIMVCDVGTDCCDLLHMNVVWGNGMVGLDNVASLNCKWLLPHIMPDGKTISSSSSSSPHESSDGTLLHYGLSHRTHHLELLFGDAESLT